jgi:hypothetical protein
MSDSFWDGLDRRLPRPRGGPAAWSSRRARILAAVRGESPAPGRATVGLAGGLVMAALAFAVLRGPGPATPPTAAAPSEELELMEAVPMLEDLDVLLDATELDPA